MSMNLPQNWSIEDAYEVARIFRTRSVIRVESGYDDATKQTVLQFILNDGHIINLTCEKPNYRVSYPPT